MVDDSLGSSSGCASWLLAANLVVVVSVIPDGQILRIWPPVRSFFVARCSARRKNSYLASLRSAAPKPFGLWVYARWAPPAGGACRIRA